MLHLNMLQVFGQTVENLDLEWGWKGRVSFLGRIKCEDEEQVKSEAQGTFETFPF